VLPLRNLDGNFVGKAGCKGNAYEGLRLICTDPKCRYRPAKTKEEEEEGAGEDTEVRPEDAASLAGFAFEEIPPVCVCHLASMKVACPCGSVFFQ